MRKVTDIKRDLEALQQYWRYPQWKDAKDKLVAVQDEIAAEEARGDELSRLRAENAELRAVCKRALVWLAKAEIEGINANCAMPCDLPECQNQIEAILAKGEAK